VRIAVIGATGTAGSRTTAKLENRGVDVVEISRSTGVDLITGTGLLDALDGVDVAIDTSNAFPSVPSVSLYEGLTSATRNVVHACAAQRVGHLVFLSIIGVDNPVFDDFPYYVAKRAQDEIVAGAAVPSTTVKSTQWHEFATNPAAVTVANGDVLVEDWLIQPVAVDTVAEVLIEAAHGEPGVATRTITGPEVIRLPELTRRLLRRFGDSRDVRTVRAAKSPLADGALLAPDDAEVIGPDVEGWLRTSDAETVWRTTVGVPH
jgi:uncharacterized protein YbjT (DUF2867 family)